MSAYTALVSLRQILVTILHLQQRHNVHNRPQLQNLLEEVDMLLSFLDISSTHEATTQRSELEAKMRDAAHEAEHLIDHGILSHETTSSGKFLFLSILFMMLSPLPARLGLIPVWAPLILVEAVICIINAAFMYLRIRERYGFPTKNVSREWRRLFHDFKIIVEEVNRMKESSSGISAHEALVSLSQILGSIVLDDSGYCAHHLKSLQEKVSFLLENNASSSSSTCTQNLDAKMRDAVYKAKRALVEFRLPRKSDLIVDRRLFFTLPGVLSLISPAWVFMLFRHAYYIGVFPFYLRIAPPENQMPTRLEMLGQMCIAYASYIFSSLIVVAVLPVRYNYEAPENQELPHIVEDFDIIVREVIEIKDGCGEEGGDHLSTTAASSRKDPSNGKEDVVVGLEGDMEEIKARLFQETSKLELISIVGMGGIGKTTLARQVYHDPAIDAHFDVRAWAAVSQENSLRHVLLSLLDSAHMLTEEEKRQDSDEELGVYLHRFLMYRRYLIIVDDMWDTEIWDFLRRHFPENCNDSRVLLTSRLPNVVSRLDSSSRLHHMQCLNENLSWDLLCTEVFGVEGCPLELESIGRKIAQRCGGLPLAIIVIGGLLYKDVRIEVWIDIAEKIEKSQVQDIKEQCLDILGLSYNHLPRHLRHCFLYTGVFLAHSEILISRLINLWIAEGFLRPCESKTLEEVAESYLKDLIERNLVSVTKRSYNGKIRRCSMHDLLRDVCVENARKEKFRHIVELGGYVITREGPDEPPRSLSIHPNAVRVDHINDYLGSVHLRVVNVVGANFSMFPSQITQLVSLRYLALQYDGLAPIPLPPSMYKLQYLETLVLHHSSFGKYSYLPSSIWRMPNLRHIYVKPGCYMFKLVGHQYFYEYSLLINLQTLVGIRNFKWTRGIIQKIPNLKKLGISYDFSSPANWWTYQLENLVFLVKLETLKITVKYDDLGSAMPSDSLKVAFPQKLKKLSLSGCRIPLESMTAIGELPNLEALKLRCKAFCGPTWKTVEGDFSRLVYLLLEEMSFTTWETEGSHFPRLQRLVLRSCVMLEEIPSSIGDIPTLELIELVDCHVSAVASARDIQEEQGSMGNEYLKFLIEQRRKDADGMNFGNLEARGVGPGFFEVLNDAMYSTKLEVQVAVVTMLYLLLLVSGLVFVSSFNLTSSSLR